MLMRSTASLVEDGTDPSQQKLSDSFYQPRGYSLFSGRAIEEKEEVQKDERVEDKLEFDDDDCENLTVRDIRFHDKQYNKYEINALLCDMLVKNGFTCTDTIRNMYTEMYRVYTSQELNKTVAVFSVVKDRDDKIFNKDDHIWSLQEALCRHKDLKERNDLIIVPLCESIVPHFRLLTMDLRNNIGLYHDSRSLVASSTLDLGRACVSAVTQQLAILDPRLGLGVPSTLPNFLDSYNYVYETCARYFYNIKVEVNCLNHQAFNNFKDSGAYAVAYADLFLQGVDLKQPFALDIDTKKEEYHQLLNPKPKQEEAKTATARPSP